MFKWLEMVIVGIVVACCRTGRLQRRAGVVGARRCFFFLFTRLKPPMYILVTFFYIIETLHRVHIFSKKKFIFFFKKNDHTCVHTDVTC